jgi:PAS domain S-box-containing protein
VSGPDDLQNDIQVRLTRLLPAVLRAALIVAVVVAASEWFHRHERHVAWWTYETSIAVTLVAVLLLRLGRPRLAGAVFSMGFFAMAAAAVLLLGGALSPACFVLIPVVLTCALFWSWRAGAVVAAASILLVLFVSVDSVAQRLPAPLVRTPSALAGVVAGSVVMTAVLVGTALRSLREAAADAHRRTRELFALFQESPDAIVVLDEVGIVRDINPAALAISNLDVRDVVGRHFAALPVFLSADAAVAIRRFSGLLRGARRTFALRLRGADGSVFWGDARSRVLTGDDGARRLQVTVRDVTQRKLAEARHAELEGQLLKLQRFETIGRLSGAVAHDVNNLLTIVSLVASSLRSQLGPEARELADELYDSASRAAKLNRRLLLVGRQDVVHVGGVDLNHVIDGMRRLLQRIVEQPRELVVQLDGAACVVRADPAQIEQILINLVTNARDAMTGEGRLTVRTQRREGSVVMSVSDTGSGIDAATQGRMFEPFFTTKGSAGTGMGLAAVRDIVTSYGGSIVVESQPGLGTRFEVRLPAGGADSA